MKSKTKNPVAERSKAKMRESFIELLKQKSYNSITIKEICENAGLVRQTFYTNFTVKDDIVRNYLDSIIAEIQRDFIRPNSTLGDLVYGTFVCCERHSDGLRQLYKNGFINMMIERFTQKNLILSGKFRMGAKNKYYESYYSGAILSVVCSWMQSGMRPSAREVTGIVMEILNSPVRRIF